nr:FMRFamide-gated sodium channel-like 2 [Malacoceros fuliginosus]
MEYTYSNSDRVNNSPGGPTPNNRTPQHTKMTLSKEKLHELEQEFLHTKTKDIVNKFMTTTTAHGWGRVGSENNIFIKLFWVAITLTAFGANVTHVLTLVLQYRAFPSEQVSDVELSSIEFPSVTICNIQPMSVSTGLEMMQDPSTQLYQWDNLTQFYYDMAKKDGNLSYEEELKYNRLKQPIGYFENIGDEATRVGHQPRDFLLSCTFGYRQCTWDNFTFFQSPTYYNCYTFNGNKSSENLVARTTGPQEGLSLILYLESDNGDELYNGTYHTLSNVGNAAGARVIVHPPNSRPSPVDQGFDVPPGFSSSVGVKATRYERLGEPYGPCVEDTMHGSDLFVYATDTCVTLCQQRYVMNACDCVSSLLPIPEYNESNLKYCGNFDAAHQEYFFSNLSCEAASLAEFVAEDNVRESCGCHPPCEEYSYKTDVSYSYWPLDFTQLSFYQSYVLNHPDVDNLKAYQNLENYNTSELISTGLIRKNFLRLNVYLKDLIIQEYIQKKSYEIQNLISDMGGTFGLWIGMSVITWCEVVELLIRLTSRSVRKLVHSGEMQGSPKHSQRGSGVNSPNSMDNKVSPRMDPHTAHALGLQDCIVYKEVQV